MNTIICMILLMTAAWSNTFKQDQVDKIQEAFDIALESRKLDDKQVRLLSNLSTFFFYAEPHQVRVILKTPHYSVDRLYEGMSSDDKEDVFDNLISLLFMTKKLRKYSNPATVFFDIFNSKSIGLDAFDILKIVGTNQDVHPPYDEQIEDEDYCIALYDLLTEIPTENFETRMKSDKSFKKWMPKLFLKVRQLEDRVNFNMD